ncbi:SDR family NAD(P)-dependent oxidoreductase [Nocardia sp. 348MFTsu5.1]|uniref:SDR family NAD(P)-dependent oxidoreductase n=1 Tax=Nocardia sp. 348MFTsu5.1 TaxID=1172185 RepID=UPI000361E87A|nr:SDR family NAD(P)-dependent oxidoreductase [Nocardia sp. 348MFTsu5.1]
MGSRFAGKVAVVTGAASGIGTVVAEQFAAEGASVVLADIDDVKGEEAVNSIRSAGGNAIFLHHDVMIEDSWIATIAAAKSEFGGINVLVNNAGGNRPNRLVDMSFEDWKFQIGLNLDGAFLGMKYATPVITESGGGSVVNVSSEAGMNPWVNSSAYCASKSGLKMLTKVAALENAYDKNNVRVNSVHPGIIETPAWGPLSLMTEGEEGQESDVDKFAKFVTPLKHAGKPIDIANAVLFLAHDDSRYITGSELLVDGGSAIAPPDAANH